MLPPSGCNKQFCAPFFPWCLLGSRIPFPERKNKSPRCQLVQALRHPSLSFSGSILPRSPHLLVTDPQSPTPMPPSPLILLRGVGGGLGSGGGAGGGDSNGSSERGIPIAVTVVLILLGVVLVVALFFAGRRWKRRGEAMYRS